MASMNDALREIDFDNAMLEDSAPLMALWNAIAVRYSVLNRTPSSTFWWSTVEYGSTRMQLIKAIKDAINALAPSFIDMEYPYWDFNWTKFPQMHSSKKISKDEDHNLNLLPANGMSFDDKSIDLYRKFLKNCAYWLLKFHAIKSDKSWYDETYRRSWQWRSFEAPLFPLEYNAYENGTYIEGASASTLTQLQNGGQGILDRTGGSFLKNGFLVHFEAHRNESRHFSHERNAPLKEYHDSDLGLDATGIPHILNTINPTGYEATMYWYVIPQTNWAQHNIGNQLDFEYAVTGTDSGTSKTWGDQNQYSGTEYSVESTSCLEEFYTYRRGEPKREHHVLTEASWNSTGTKRTIDTNWSDDGSRSFNIVDTTEHDSYRPGTLNWRNYTEYHCPTFNDLVQPMSSLPPRFSPGMISPHETISFTVCEMNALPTPSYPIPPIQYPAGIYEWGIEKTSNYYYYGNTGWYPVLDFGDFVIPEPEEEEGSS